MPRTCLLGLLQLGGLLESGILQPQLRHQLWESGALRLIMTASGYSESVNVISAADGGFGSSIVLQLRP
jgi:hypothetical protein